MFNQAVIGLKLPKRLSTDNDPLFEFHQWGANLRVIGVEEIKSTPHTPTSHPFIERLIGAIRREYLDHLFFWNEYDLEIKLREFAAYFNENRIHYSLSDGRTPNEMSVAQELPPSINPARIKWQSHCGGCF